MGVCTVEQVWFYEIDASSLKLIKEKFGRAICPVDNSFWSERKNSVCATLMLV